MAGPVRVTMFFGQSQTGWSETWWFPPGRGTLLYSKLQSLAAKRVDLLSSFSSLLAVRITEEGANRFTRLLLAGKPTVLDDGVQTIQLPSRGKEDGASGDLEGPPDQVRSALQIEVVKDSQRIGLRYLAGFPDDISLTEQPTMNTNFAKVWWKMFNAFRREVIDNGWAIQALDKTSAFPLINVVNYRIAAPAPAILGAVIPVNAPWTHVVGQKVALQGVKMTRRGLVSPNGSWIIDKLETDTPNGTRTVWLRGTEDFDPSTFLTLGKLRAISNAYVVPTWLEPLRVGIHKRGKPFGSPVGRRATR